MEAGQSRLTVPAANGERAFGPLDRAAIELSRGDPIGSVLPAIGTVIAAEVFGIRQRYALANPRLEALRRYAVLYRTHRDSGEDLARLGVYTLTEGERRNVRSLVDGWTAASAAGPERRAWMTVPLLAAVVACVIASRLA